MDNGNRATTRRICCQLLPLYFVHFSAYTAWDISDLSLHMLCHSTCEWGQWILSGCLSSANFGSTMMSSVMLSAKHALA